MRRAGKKGRSTLERLWAYLSIQQLLERGQVTESDDLSRLVLELALRVSASYRPILGISRCTRLLVLHVHVN